MAYNEAVEMFSPRAVEVTADNLAAAGRYLESMQARGGTNIHDALIESLRQPPENDRLPIVLFLTDGRPTIGRTDEKSIRAAAESANRYGKRVFTFGVGVDVNSPLLEHVASESRGTATFVLPGEDIELKVARMFERLSGPVLASPQLTVLDEHGRPAAGRTRDLIPWRLPDLFDRDQLVLLGQYLGDGPLVFRLSGHCPDGKRSFQFRFDLDKATTRNSFVPRLWAQRKIAVLVDAIRASGAERPGARPEVADPRVKELVDEIVRLSTEFGVLTEYTAFLAREGTDLTRTEQLAREAWHSFDARARQVRSGLGAINQDVNLRSQKSAGQLNYRNSYWDANMDRAQVTSVQQVADRAFYRKGGRWVDSRLVNQTDAGAAQRAVEYGSEEHMELARQLARDNRQGALMMHGEILLDVDGQAVLVRNQ
ncbi:MAG: VWA domain-containing protein [Planctomycetes bacterium]|nr:VWA domain-containing protein [Planctomycetota bacterium]